ncbi:hypothetical protein ScPMuIL_004881 [Solemya velum]
MGVISQLGKLFWKNYVLRKRHPFLFALEILWPILIVAVVVLIRYGIQPSQHETCGYQERAMPSAGMIPFVQSFTCNLENKCDKEDSRGGRLALCDLRGALSGLPSGCASLMAFRSSSASLSPGSISSSPTVSTLSSSVSSLLVCPNVTAKYSSSSDVCSAVSQVTYASLMVLTQLPVSINALVVLDSTITSASLLVPTSLDVRQGFLLATICLP